MLPEIDKIEQCDCPYHKFSNNLIICFCVLLAYIIVQKNYSRVGLQALPTAALPYNSLMQSGLLAHLRTNPFLIR